MISIYMHNGSTIPWLVLTVEGEPNRVTRRYFFLNHPNPNDQSCLMTLAYAFPSQIQKKHGTASIGNCL